MRHFAAMLIAPVLCVCSIAAHAAEPAPLRVLGDVPPRGMWRAEMLDLGDGRPVSAGTGVSICMEAAADLARRPETGPAVKCTTKTVENTPARAKLESTCTDGSRSSVVLTRESSKVIRFEAADAGGRTTKGRWHYEGPCSGSSPAVSLGKDSPQCRELREQMADASPEKVCADAPAGERANCMKMAAAQLSSQFGPLLEMCR